MTDPSSNPPNSTDNSDASALVMGDLGADTAVHPVRGVPGRYRVELPDHWDYVMPAGGALMTCALRAMGDALRQHERPDLRPMSATTTFLTPVPVGTLFVDVKILRLGGTAAQVRADLWVAKSGAPGLTITGTWARPRSGPEFQDVAMPDVPLPSNGPMDEPSTSQTRFEQRYDMSRAIGHPPWRGDWSAGPALYGIWVRYRVPQRLADGTMDPYALPPIVDTMPPSVYMAVGPEPPILYAPSLDLTVHWVRPTTERWLLTRARTRAARAGYATADIEIFDRAGHLIAYGAQTMLVSQLKNAPFYAVEGKSYESKRSKNL